MTAKVIDGKRIYFGDYRRINNLTWFLTASTPRLSKDLTDRGVIIRIGRQRVENFDKWIDTWLAPNRNKLIADLLAILSGPDHCMIENENLDRWDTWQRAVLQKLPCGNELTCLVKQLRPMVDADTDEADQVAEQIERFLSKCRFGSDNINPDRTKIAIPNTVIVEILRNLWHDVKCSDNVVRQRLNNLLGCGRLSNLQSNPSRKFGRTMIWSGDQTDLTDNIIYPWSESWLEKIGADFISAEHADQNGKPWWDQ